MSVGEFGYCGRVEISHILNDLSRILSGECNQQAKPDGVANMRDNFIHITTQILFVPGVTRHDEAQQSTIHFTLINKLDSRL